MAVSQNSPEAAGDFYAELPKHDVDALWQRLGTLLPPEPTSAAKPALWPYERIRELLMEAGEIVSAEEAERRVLMLVNPGLAPKAAAATNLYSGIQLVLPDEVAPAHRHAAAALRFVIEGSGGYTAVNGERTIMQPGDLVLTPAWSWHDHGNETEAPMIWLDGLDLPLINDMESNFFGGAREKSQDELRPADSSWRKFGAGPFKPMWDDWQESYSPVVNYPWSRVEGMLRDAAAETDGTAADGVIFQYIDPTNGAPVMPTMAAYIQLLKPGLHTEAHQHTSSAVYHVVRGGGRTIVGGHEIRWQERDTFVVPGWEVHEHIIDTSEPAVLFSFTDDPVQRSLGFLREQSASRQG